MDVRPQSNAPYVSCASGGSKTSPFRLTLRERKEEMGQIDCSRRERRRTDWVCFMSICGSSKESVRVCCFKVTKSRQDSRATSVLERR